MADGLHSFVYREIRELVLAGLEIHIFPTRVGIGPYMPMRAWPLHRASLFGLVSAHVNSIIRDTRRYLSVLHEALRFSALVDFVLATFVSESVLRRGLHMIHCHFGDHKLFIGYFASQLSRKPISVTIHAYELYNNPNPGLFRHALRQARAVVTVSDFNRRILKTQWNVQDERVHVIRLFAELPPKADPHLPLNGKMVILMVARLVAKKGHRTLLTALSKLPDQFQAWIVGSGPLDVKAMAGRLGVGDRVRIMGRLSDSELRKIYEKANVFCLPSETPESGDREGIPVALMEAMAYGLPVVATRHAGVPELVEEILVDEGNSDQLARALTVLGQNSDLRARQGARNRKIVGDRFSRKNVFLLASLFGRIANDSA